MMILNGAQYLSYPQSTVNLTIGTAGLTVCCWFLPTAYQGLSMIASRNCSAGFASEWWALTLVNNQYRGLIGNASGATALNTNVTPTTGKADLLAITWNTTSKLAVMLVNGTQVANATVGVTMTSDTTPLCVGGKYNSDPATNAPTELLTGGIEDLRMYNRPLAVNELDAIRLGGGQDQIYSGLVQRWPFTDTSGYVSEVSPVVPTVVGTPTFTAGRTGGRPYTRL